MLSHTCLEVKTSVGIASTAFFKSLDTILAGGPDTTEWHGMIGRNAIGVPRSELYRATAYIFVSSQPPEHWVPADLFPAAMTGRPV